MADVLIKTLKNGPLQVRGPIELVDAKDATFTLVKDLVYLCRCGHSADKPFCDGTHANLGFKSEEPAR
ncbi:MAG: iron-binding protein [Deltaproteobacteria bacterium]|nr:iron-binding protein [Deltaproteobacteria bacterium]